MNAVISLTASLSNYLTTIVQIRKTDKCRVNLKDATTCIFVVTQETWWHLVIISPFSWLCLPAPGYNWHCLNVQPLKKSQHSLSMILASSPVLSHTKAPETMMRFRLAMSAPVMGFTLTICQMESMWVLCVSVQTTFFVILYDVLFRMRGILQLSFL